MHALLLLLTRRTGKWATVLPEAIENDEFMVFDESEAGDEDEMESG